MKNTIELNGNLYDAVSGKMLGAASKPQTKTSGSNIDGIFRSRTSAVPAPATQKIGVIATPHHQPKAAHARSLPNHARAHQPQTSRRASSAASASATVQVNTPQSNSVKIIVNPNHAKAHKPQTATTLMRTAVKRPRPSFKQQAVVQGALAPSRPDLIPVKHVASHIDDERLVRATGAATHPMVAHHGRTAASPLSVAVAHVPVKPVPVKPRADVPPAIPAPQPNNKQDIFDHALANASNFVDIKAHRARHHKQARQHSLSMAMATLALLLIAVFAAYQNSPGLQMKVAGVKAGFSTTMPNLKAAGFAWNGVHAQSGKLVVGFSGTNGSYQLSQQPTNWSSSDMIHEVASVDASGRSNYTTVKAGNTTVYRFSNSSATWVSGGTWYNVSGNSALSNDQIRNLVQNI